MVQITLNSCEEGMISLHQSRTSSLDAGPELPARVRRVPISPKNTSGMVLEQASRRNRRLCNVVVASR